MMVKELQGNIFSNLKKIDTSLVFDDEKLWQLFVLKHGERVLRAPLDKWGAVGIAEMLILEYGEKWRLFSEQMSKFTNYLGGVRVTETFDKQELLNNVNDTLNKIAAYDSDDLFVNDGNNTTNKSSNTLEYTKTLLNENVNIKDLLNSLQAKIENDIIKLVVNDTKNFITLEIYESRTDT